MRAVVEYHGVEAKLPDIIVTVVRGKEDLSIRVRIAFLCISNRAMQISDQGGGVPRTTVENLFHYMYRCSSC